MQLFISQWQTELIVLCCSFKKPSIEQLRSAEYLQSVHLPELDSVSVHRGLDERLEPGQRAASPLAKSVC